MEERSRCCCFTGHRPQRMPWLKDETDLRTRALRQALWLRISNAYRDGYTCFLSGMAMGTDLICAELVLRLKEEHPEVTLIPVVPYPGQSKGWNSGDFNRYRRILQECAKDMVIVCPRYEKTCYYQRNRYLVDHSNRIIGVYDGSPTGGTHQTLAYAKAQGIEMELLAGE